MTAKTLKANSEVVPWYTLCALTLEEILNHANIELRHKFNES